MDRLCSTGTRANLCSAERDSGNETQTGTSWNEGWNEDRAWNESPAQTPKPKPTAQRSGYGQTDRQTDRLTHAVTDTQTGLQTGTRGCGPEGCRRLRAAAGPWNELEREAGTRERAGTRNWNEDQNWNELERDPGTRPRLERGLLERGYR